MKEQQTKKNQKFIQPKKSKTGLYSIIGVVVVLVIVGTYFFVSSSRNSAANPKVAADTGQKVNYSSNASLEQTVIDSKVENGKEIIATLSTVKDKKFIRTDYQANGKTIPLTAFVQPDGKVMVAVSYCEPCQGNSFHISGNQIICNTCGTTWDLQTLKGISGGCQAYPPQALTYSLDGDNLEIQQSTLDSWSPRV